MRFVCTDGASGRFDVLGGPKRQIKMTTLRERERERERETQRLR